jgi:hypothetical protein
MLIIILDLVGRAVSRAIEFRRCFAHCDSCRSSGKKVGRLKLKSEYGNAPETSNDDMSRYLQLINRKFLEIVETVADAEGGYALMLQPGIALDTTPTADQAVTIQVLSIACEICRRRRQGQNRTPDYDSSWICDVRKQTYPKHF